VIQFRPRDASRSARQFRVTDPLKWLEETEERRRMQQNLAAALVVVLLVTTGMWLISRLSAHACLEAGRGEACALPRGSSLRHNSERPAVRWAFNFGVIPEFASANIRDPAIRGPTLRP
jgi:hypothetical protein